MNFKRLIFSLLFTVVLSFSAESEVSAKDKAAKEVVYFSAITLYHPIVMYQYAHILYGSLSIMVQANI